MTGHRRQLRTAVVTITHGRDEHLHRQRLGLALDHPDLHVVVGMDDHPHLMDIGGPAPTVVELPSSPRGLPLAAARNRGAQVALGKGAEVLVFLDVDCIPGPRLVSRYADAVAATDPPSLLCGPVGYLPPPPPGGYPTDLGSLGGLHPARPSPPAGQLWAETRFELFWSLSFAVGAQSWGRFGGFHEGYVGYGAEDTDFAFCAASEGGRLYWVGGAEAYHQHHPPSREDPARVAEMVGNARLFHSRHGFWPMRGWLDDLAAGGAIEIDADGGWIRALA